MVARFEPSVSRIPLPFHHSSANQARTPTRTPHSAHSYPDTPPVPICWQVNISDVVILAAVCADAAPTALLHQHLMTEGQIQRQLYVRNTGQLLRLGHSPGGG
jgi:hypothetical protein